jgi:hypothetical protein
VDGYPSVAQPDCLLGHVSKPIEMLQAKTIDGSMITSCRSIVKQCDDVVKYRGAGLGIGRKWVGGNSGGTFKAKLRDWNT